MYDDDGGGFVCEFNSGAPKRPQTPIKRLIEETPTSTVTAVVDKRKKLKTKLKLILCALCIAILLLALLGLIVTQLYTLIVYWSADPEEIPAWARFFLRLKFGWWYFPIK